MRLARGQIIVWGLLASSPFGGMTWQVLQYLVALRRLGYDVWYVEDSDRPLLDPVRFWPSDDHRPNVRYMDRQLRAVGLGDRWVFRPPEGSECLGARDASGLRRLYAEADAAINLCGAQELRPEHDVVRRRIYLETDPTADQVRVANRDPAKLAELDAYDVLFTYGENLGADDCLVPIERYTWLPTRPPVIAEWWETSDPPKPGAHLTTITNWKKNARKDVVWRRTRWRWNKQDELRRFVDLPRRSSLPLGLAISAIDTADWAMLEAGGWRLRPATDLADPDAYRRFIRDSAGEFTIAKEQYVAPRTGWFSDRSVCYLAAGRPVVTQDTGFGKFVPTGEGLFAFGTVDEAAAAIEEIHRDYARHSRAARGIARDYFEATHVVRDLLERAGLG